MLATLKTDVRSYPTTYSCRSVEFKNKSGRIGVNSGRSYLWQKTSQSPWMHTSFYGEHFNLSAVSHARFPLSVFGIKCKAYGAVHSFQIYWCSKHILSRNFFSLLLSLWQSTTAQL